MGIANGAFTRTNEFSDDKERIIPRFHEEAVLDQAASDRTGFPVYRSQERVQIHMPGNNLNAPVEIVTDSHRQRWPEAYKRFKDGLEMSHDGTPLEQCAFLPKAVVKELKGREVHTVEQLAALDDLALQRIGMGGLEMRKMAKAFLDDAVRMASLSTSQAETNALKGEVDALKQQVENLSQLLRETHSSLVAKRDEHHPIMTAVPHEAYHAGESATPPESSMASFAKKTLKLKDK
jgi:hypothetical protein